MRALLDTHIVLWWLADDARLNSRYRDLVAEPDNELYVSAVTIAEVSIKSSLGKLKAPGEIVEAVESQAFIPLPLTLAHAAALPGLPWHHRDPFDRMLIAQASIEGLPLMTVDRRFREYDVECV